MKDTDIFRALCALRLRLALLAVDESGMSTVEYSTIKLYNDCARWSHLPRPRMNSVSAGDGCKDCYWQTKGFLDR